jgi:hypothetical protein
MAEAICVWHFAVKLKALPFLSGRRAESVMVPAGNNDQFRTRGTVDQAVNIVNASGPVS